MYDMKTSTITIRLDKDLDKLLKRSMPFAEARGFLTDEDIFTEVS